MNLCPRFVHTLYCDDVRQEVSGKMTFVGAYQGDLNVRRVEPTILPKLCIVVNIQTPKITPFKSLLIRVLKDDSVLQEVALPQSIIDEIVDSPLSENKKYHTYGMIIELLDMPVEESCTIRVRAQSESEELASAGLRINLLDHTPPLNHMVVQEVLAKK